VVAQPQRTRLRAQRRARAHPVEQRRPGHLGKQLVAQRMQRLDALARGYPRVIGEGNVDSLGGQLGRDRCDVCPGRMHDQADVWLRGGDVDEFVNVQQLVRDRGHLVGRGHPRSHQHQQRELRRKRGHAQAPAWNRLHPARRAQHHVNRLRVCVGDGTAVRITDGAICRRGKGIREACLHVGAQLVGVVGQPQEVERCHRAGVQPGVADRQPV
jgi:hypothetical protein